MAEPENSEIVPQQAEPKNPFLLFPKFQLRIPFFNLERRVEKRVVKEEPSNAGVVGEGDNEKGSQKPNVVSFPNNRPMIPLPIEAEVEESSGKTHNPVIIWQVYALGGFIILQWMWARWKERKERGKKAASDDNQSADENQSPADTEE